MTIKPGDIEAIRAVLDGALTPAEAARAHSPTQHVLLAHAALVAGGFSRPAWKGQYGELLDELALVPGLPGGKLPQSGFLNDLRANDPKLYNWYCDESPRLIPMSRRLGLHRADRSGSELGIIPNCDVRDLLVDGRRRLTAVTLYDKAIAEVNARHAYRRDLRHRNREFRAAAGAHPLLGYYFRNYLLRYEGDPQQWVDVHAELGRLVRQYFPEL
jgi:hypothetical protein